MSTSRPARVAGAPWVDEAGASHAVALEVLLHGPIPRGEIARRLNLSAGSLTRLAKPLIERGLLAETDSASGEESRTGRPSKPLDIVPSARSFIGLKITSSSITGTLTDLRAEPVAIAVRELSGVDPTAVSDTVVDLVRELGNAGHAVSGLGIGLGGLVRDHNVVVSTPFLNWEQVPFGSIVEAATGIPTTVENDLLAFTAYENWFGAGRGHDNFAVITLGAGVGFGLVVHGDLVTDTDSGLGLVGHWPIDPYGPICPSGHRGCARAMLTTSAITSGVESITGRPVTYDEALDLAASDPGARRIVDDAGRGLGRLIAAVENLTAPELVVLGGEGVRLATVASDTVQAGIRADRDERARAIPLVTAPGHDVEWARGAAVLAMRSYILDDRRHTETS